MRHELAEWAASNAAWLLFGGAAVTLITRQLLLRHFKKRADWAQSTWSPFQSTEARDIAEHLTPGERSQIISDATQYGREVAWRIALPFGIVGASFAFSSRAGFTLLGLFAVYAVVFQRHWFREYQHQSRQMLCQTEHGRMKGYHPDTLRLFTFPWSRCKP